MMVAMATPKRHVCLVAMLVVLAVLSCHLNRVASVVMQADQAAALLNIKSAMRAHQHHVGPKAPRGANNTTGGPAEHKGGHATHLHHVDRHKMCPSLFPSSTSAPPCLPFPIRPSATALLNIKAAMGLTYTTWVATKPCTLNGATAAAGEWERVTCSADGLAYSMWMPWNFLDGSLSDYLKFFSTLTNLNQLAMQYMFFSGSFPSVLTTLPSLTSLSLRFNYLTGSLPSTITKIKSLDINQNYFVGSIPSGTWSYCDATNNCLTGAGNCQNYYQRSSCAICGSTAGTGTLCAAGQSCMPSADAKIAAGQNNYGGEVALSCVYTPITMNLADAAAMLNVKASLGVTYTTWAATTPCRFDQSTVALANEWTGVRCTDTGKVSDIVVNNANLKGSLPSDLASLTALTNIGAPGNYLIGTVPPLGPLLLVLDLNFNFISDLPSAAYTWCGGNLNCLVTPSKCTTGGTVQRVAADCAFCGTTNGAPPFCWGAGGVCTPDAAAAVAAGTTNPNSQPTLPRACVGGPVVALKDTTGRPPTACFPPCWPIPCVRLIPPPSPACPAPAMLALKASLGVTLTTWAATVPCQLAGQTTTAAVWSGVLCDSTGRVVSMRCLPYLHTIFICSPALARILHRSVLPPTVVHLRAVANSKLKGSLASDISTLTALTYLNLQGNLLSYRIDSFTTNLRALPVLADIGAVYNYFIGTVPALASGLLTLDVRGNFLTDVPTASYTWCGGAGNCLLTPSKCTSGGSAQRPAADCAFCGTTNGVRPFCAAGGVCTVDSGSAVNTGAVNLPTQPVLPMACVGGPLYMNAGDGEWVLFERSHRGPIGEYCLRGPIASALLNIKSAMGLTYTSWAATNPCTLEGAAGKAGEWERVTCTPFGRAYVLARARTYACVCEHVCRNLDSAGLVRKSFPSDISKLTGLGVVWMPWNFLDGSLADYLTYFSTLTNLNQLAMQYMFFSGTFPSVLTTLPLLTSLALRFNYLTGLLPTSITKIKSLDLYQNYFVGSIPSGTWSYCNAANNCLGSVGANCQNAFQRSSCAICGSTAGTGTLCAAGQSCMPSADAKIAAKQNNYGGEVALSCVYTPITMNPADGLVPRHTPLCPVTLLCALSRSNAPHHTPMRLTTLLCASPHSYAPHHTPMRLTTLLCASPRSYAPHHAPIRLTTLLCASPRSYAPHHAPMRLTTLLCASPRSYAPHHTPMRLTTLLCASPRSYAPHHAPMRLTTLLCASPRSYAPHHAPMRLTTLLCASPRSYAPHHSAVHPHLSPPAAAAMLNVKASLGVTYTTWAATTPCRFDQSTVALANEWTGVRCTDTGKVSDIVVNNANLKGSLPSDLASLTALTNIGAPGNYLIGTVPPLGPLLLVLDLNFNFISDLPSAAYTWCGGNLNCLVTPSKCTTGGTVQRVAADCAFCGTTNGAPPFCWGAGGVCTPDAAAAVAAGTTNPNSQPALPRACVGGPVVALKDTTAMLALKASLGVTLTTWAATVPCQLAGQTTTAAVWSGVLCDSTGRVVSMAVANSKLKGSLASDISTLTALTYLNLQGNLLSYRLDSFTTNLRALPVLADIGAVYNYFTGTVPALASGLLTLDVRGNFLTDVPTASYTWCGGAGNCLLTPSKCTSGGSAQRPAADCAFCGTTNGVGPFCWAGAGGVCAVDAAAPIAAGTVNSPTQPVRPMACAGGSVVVIKESTAVCHLSLHPCTKAPVLYSLHPNRHPFSAPYLLLANPPLLSVPPRLAVCAPRLAVCALALLCAPVALCLTLALLSVSPSPYCLSHPRLTASHEAALQAPLAGFTANLPPLTATLKELLSVLLHSASVALLPRSPRLPILRSATLPSLSLLSLGSILPLSSSPPRTRPSPPVLPRVISSLPFSHFPSLPCSYMQHNCFLQYNWFYGSMPAALLNMQSLSVLWCDGHTNCFTTPSVCGMGGTTQRPAADCAICGSTNAQPPFCGGTGTCAPDSAAAAALGTPNVMGSATLPLVCGGVPIDAADATVLLALKSSLGVTLSNWNAAALCTLEGQTLLPAQWGGVRCTAAGKVTERVSAGMAGEGRRACECGDELGLALTRQKLQGVIHPDISSSPRSLTCKPTALTCHLRTSEEDSDRATGSDLGYNLFQGRLDFFAAPLKPLTSLKALFFHYNYFAGSIPSAIATLPQLTSLGLFSNYLTGTVPIPAKTLLALDVGFNFLSGTFPKLPLMFCAGDNNCFLNSTACRTYGIVQRPAGACAICGTPAAGQGDLCFGGSCTPDAAAAVTASTVNSPNQPILPWHAQCV
ncbi:unnamed protein product, partial [Closterium sp. NIES-65]